ncbi:MAG: thioredoxin domain-containing protein [Terriglobia bacterium]|nr:thioredoxin domain-containing protein [Terriglobia bacterium]
MKLKLLFLSIIAMAMVQGAAAAIAQPTQQRSQAPASSESAAPPPLPLNNITPPDKIQFPPANPKDFTAPAPTTQEVNAFLKQVWGYDPNRVWQVMGIQTTEAPNVSRVTILVGEQGVSRGPAPTIFFVTPDGNHAISGTSVVAFGAHPFAAVQQKLEQGAVGPYRGSSSKSLMLVEFADLQCPDCKAAAGTMDKLVQDFPNARVVFQYFPLTTIHPQAEKAAEYGVCVAQEKGNAAFFQYVQAVFDTQDALRTDADGTLNAAVAKAGANASQVAACASTPAAANAVAASVKLGNEVGVDQTPTLFVNGRPVPITALPYTSLKQIVAYDAPGGDAPTAAAATETH